MTTEEALGHRPIVRIRPGSVLLVAVATVALLGNYFEPGYLIAIVVLATVTTIVIDSQARAIGALALACLPYAFGAYVGAVNGIRFFPRPATSAYWEVSREQATGVLVVLLLCLLTPIAGALQRNIGKCAQWCRIRPFGRSTVRAVAITACAIGIMDAVTVTSRLGEILATDRHSAADDMIVGNQLAGIVLCFTVTLILGSDYLYGRQSPRFSLLALGILWTPTLLAGARNYFSVCAVMLIALYLAGGRSRRRTLAVLATSITGAVVFFYVPSLWAEDPTIGFNEWILPNSLVLPLYLKAYTLSPSVATPFFDQWQFLLPSFMRFHEVRSYAAWFTSQEATGVPVGGSPWSDFYSDSMLLRIFFFAGITVGLVLISLALSKLHPAAAIVCVGVMFFWGRSLFWGVASQIVYTVMVLAFVALVDSRIRNDADPVVEA